MGLTHNLLIRKAFMKKIIYVVVYVVGFETYETIEFDSSGECNICKGSAYKQQKIDWVERKLLLDKLIEKHRGKNDYDCIIHFQAEKIVLFSFII